MSDISCEQTSVSLPCFLPGRERGRLWERKAYSNGALLLAVGGLGNKHRQQGMIRIYSLVDHSSGDNHLLSDPFTLANDSDRLINSGEQLCGRVLRVHRIEESDDDNVADQSGCGLKIKLYTIRSLII